MANDAVVKLNGLLVDKRPMKVRSQRCGRLNITDCNVGRACCRRISCRACQEHERTCHVSCGIQFTLVKINRNSKSAKAQPKQAGVIKSTTDSARGTGRPVRGARGRARRGRNAGRPKTKTADELDAEMTDYFTGGVTANGEAAPATNGAATAAAANEDTGMDGVA